MASGVNAWIARKIDIVAVLRCVGATSRQVTLIYATQAAIMGRSARRRRGDGRGIPFALPGLVPRTTCRRGPDAYRAMGHRVGLLLGGCIALAFALRPLIALRRVSPLQAIRRTVDPTAGNRAGTAGCWCR